MMVVLTCRVALKEGHEVGEIKPGTAQKSALRTVFVYIYIGCSERRLIGHSFYRRNPCERAAPLAEKNAVARHHVLRSLISLHNEHPVYLNL
jgi:hypothetical protein